VLSVAVALGCVLDEETAEELEATGTEMEEELEATEVAMPEESEDEVKAPTTPRVIGCDNYPEIRTSSALCNIGFCTKEVSCSHEDDKVLGGGCDMDYAGVWGFLYESWPYQNKWRCKSWQAVEYNYWLQPYVICC